ncbi:MAG: hypothetical protein RR840_03670 [Clostridium sp.]
MNVYTITYYLKEAPHSCGCEDHEDDHNCGCSDHHHDQDHECCGGHNHDEDHECCGGHNHDDHECCGGHNHNEDECCEGHDHDCECNGEHDHEHHHHDEVRDDYEITAHIKTLGSWAHFMPTSFLVKTEKSSNEILDILAPTVIEGDMIFVNKIDKNNVSCLNPAVVDWINK